MTGIDFKLFFYGFKSFWEEIEKLVYLVESASEKEGVISLEGHLWGYRGDEFTITIDLCKKEVVEVSEPGGLDSFSIHSTARNYFEFCGVLSVGWLV